ncbi:MAG: FG-GAP-like repeat-containing protein [Agriterribacter sp.]
MFCTINSYTQIRKVSVGNSIEEDISKISFFTPSKGFVAFKKWIGYTSDSGRTFVKKTIDIGNVDYNGYSVNLTFGFEIEGVKAFDENNIITYGNYGYGPSILFSSNGGNTFKLIFHTSFNPQRYYSSVSDMIFPENNNVGYAVDLERILKTNDKGKNWSVIWNGKSEFNKLEYVDSKNIFAFKTGYENPKLIKTTDGGINWQDISIPEGEIEYVYFITSSNGWISIKNDNYGRIYATTDGGITWSLRNNPDINSFIGTRIKFLNDSIGYGINRSSSVYKTSDGGKIWERLPGDGNYSDSSYGLGELHFWDDNQFWAGGVHGFLILTTNGGGMPVPQANFSIDTNNVYVTKHVQLVNQSKKGYAYNWFVNQKFISASFNASYTHDIENSVDTIALVVSNGVTSDTLIKYQSFVVPGAPSITSYSPVAGSTGTSVRIYGNNFLDVVSVSFGNTPAASFTILSPTEIAAVVGEGGSGDIVVKNLYYPASISGFTYTKELNTAPLIYSVSPASGPVGTAVNITGSNFNSNPAKNIIYFGAVKAKVITASSTQVTCIVPTGASFEPITLLNTDTYLSGSSLRPFNVTFTDGGNFTLNSFKIQESFNPQATYFYSLKSSDIDGDGKPDIVSVQDDIGLSSIAVYRNISTPNNFLFEDKKLIANSYPYEFTLADIDGDGKQDILAAPNKEYIVFARNNSSPGNISFDPQLNLATTRGNSSIVVGDLDGNGKPDIIVGSNNSGKLSIIRNTSIPGIPSFAETENIDVPLYILSMGIGDIDGDGKIDIVFQNNRVADNIAFSYLRNTSTKGQISFVRSVDIPSNGSSQFGDVKVVDFDNDNRLDVIVGSTVYRNITTNGVIAFAAPVSLGTSLSTTMLANLSGDDKPDLVATGSLFRNLSTQGNISGDPAIPALGYFAEYGITAADFDMDGRIDIVGSGSKRLSIFSNNIPSEIVLTTCEGWAVTAESDVKGKNYVWQLDKGSGFNNIVVDDTIFAAGQGELLYYNRVPLAAQGYKLRCNVDGLFSSVFTINILKRVIPEVKLTADKTSFCYGSTVRFVADTSGVGYSSHLEWKYNDWTVDNEGTVFSPDYLKDGDRVWVILHSMGRCSEEIDRDTSEVFVMTVKGQEPGINIHNDIPRDSLICPDSKVTFTTETFYAGDNPDYQWLLNGEKVGDNNDTLVLTNLKEGDKIQAILTIAATDCAPPLSVYSNIQQMVIYPVRPPNAKITASASNICPGEEVIFTATSEKYNNGVYKWFVDSVESGSDSDVFITSALKNGSVVEVTYSAFNQCGVPLYSKSNSITINVVSKQKPAVSIMSSATEICKGTMVTFNTSFDNGGTAPVFTWLVNGQEKEGNTSEYTSSTLKDNDEVKVKMISNAACTDTAPVTSNLIIVKVNDIVTPAIEISGTNSVKAGESVTIAAIIHSATSEDKLQWQEKKTTGVWQDIPGATQASLLYAPVTTGDKLRCMYKTTYQCASPNELFSKEIAFEVLPGESGRESVRLYPNPVTNELIFDSLSISEDFVLLEITALNGTSKLVVKNIKGLTKASISVYMLSRGQYIAVFVKANGERKTVRFTKL